jgi:undecaprenyl-phosphate galactose phosphotransferase
VFAPGGFSLASLTTPLAIGRSLVSGEHAVPLISHYRAFTRALVLVAADCFAIGLAGVAAFYLCPFVPALSANAVPSDPQLLALDLAVPFAVITAYCSGRGRYSKRIPLWNEAPVVIGAGLFAATIEAAFALLAADGPRRAPVIIALVLFSVCTTIVNRLAKQALARLGLWVTPAVIVGDEGGVAEAKAALLSDRSLGYRIVSTVHPPALMSNADGPRLLPVLARHHAQCLVIAVRDDAGLQRALIETALRERISFAALALAGFACTATRFFGSDAVLLARSDGLSRPLSRFIKAVFDVTAAALLLFAMSPLLIVIALAIRTDGGPALFSHRRLGVGGRHFGCLKFRTMKVGAEQLLQDILAADPARAAEWKATQKLRDDPRITPLGHFLRKTSLDELPQLINVMRLEMSLVGPRPIVDNEVAFYGENITHYCATRPGLTGLWQVSGRSDTSYARRVQLDVCYVNNWTIWNDIAVLLKTIPAVLRRDGAR